MKLKNKFSTARIILSIIGIVFFAVWLGLQKFSPVRQIHFKAQDLEYHIPPSVTVQKQSQIADAAPASEIQTENWEFSPRTYVLARFRPEVPSLYRYLDYFDYEFDFKAGHSLKDTINNFEAISGAALLTEQQKEDARYFPSLSELASYTPKFDKNDVSIRYVKALAQTEDCQACRGVTFALRDAKNLDKLPIALTLTLHYGLNRDIKNGLFLASLIFIALAFMTNATGKSTIGAPQTMILAGSLIFAMGFFRHIMLYHGWLYWTQDTPLYSTVNSIRPVLTTLFFQAIDGVGWLHHALYVQLMLQTLCWLALAYSLYKAGSHRVIVVLLALALVGDAALSDQALYVMSDLLFQAEVALFIAALIGFMTVYASRQHALIVTENHKAKSQPWPGFSKGKLVSLGLVLGLSLGLMMLTRAPGLAFFIALPVLLVWMGWYDYRQGQSRLPLPWSLRFLVMPLTFVTPILLCLGLQAGVRAHYLGDYRSAGNYSGPFILSQATGILSPAIAEKISNDYAKRPAQTDPIVAEIIAAIAPFGAQQVSQLQQKSYPFGYAEHWVGFMEFNMHGQVPIGGEYQPGAVDLVTKIIRKHFPTQTESDVEKRLIDYSSKAALAIIVAAPFEFTKHILASLLTARIFGNFPIVPILLILGLYYGMRTLLRPSTEFYARQTLLCLAVLSYIFSLALMNTPLARYMLVVEIFVFVIILSWVGEIVGFITRHIDIPKDGWQKLRRRLASS